MKNKLYQNITVKRKLLLLDTEGMVKMSRYKSASLARHIKRI